MSELNNVHMIAFFLVLGLFGAVFFLALITGILFMIKEELKKQTDSKTNGCGPNCTCGSEKQLLKG